MTGLNRLDSLQVIADDAIVYVIDSFQDYTADCSPLKLSQCLGTEGPNNISRCCMQHLSPSYYRLSSFSPPLLVLVIVSVIELKKMLNSVWTS